MEETRKQTAKVDLITLGDELLIGIRENGHLLHIGGELSRRGLLLRRNYSCRDGREDILDTFSMAWEGADVVITTGGLGPTSDDNTREVISGFLGLPLEFREEAQAHIRARFERLGRVMTANSMKQCYAPQGATLLPNPHGTALGIFLEKDGKLLFMLPGPVGEMQPMFAKEVMPRICARGLCGQEDSYIQLRTSGIGESALELKIRPILESYPGVTVAYCAHRGIVDVRLSTATSPVDFTLVRACADACRRELGEDFVCYGHCNMAKVVFNYLRANEKTLALAESCTGGLLASAFTGLCGASKVFIGGFVCYSNDAKVEMLDVPECLLQQHGAVSAECAVAMADGAAERLGADYALSVTGFAGPSGGTPENPVGTFYIGYHSPVGSWCVKFIYPGDRQEIRELAVTRALDAMRRKLLRYQTQEAIADMLNCNCNEHEQ